MKEATVQAMLQELQHQLKEPQRNPHPHTDDRRNTNIKFNTIANTKLDNSPLLILSLLRPATAIIRGVILGIFKQQQRAKCRAVGNAASGTA